MDIERYYKYLFTPTSILKCNFTSRLWFEMYFSFLKGCYYLIILYFFFSLFVLGRSRVPTASFSTVFAGEGKQKTKVSGGWRALTTQNPKDACFHVHGSYGAVFFFCFIHRHMYFCVVGFLKQYSHSVNVIFAIKLLIFTDLYENLVSGVCVFPRILRVYFFQKVFFKKNLFYFISVVIDEF